MTDSNLHTPEPKCPTCGELREADVPCSNAFHIAPEQEMTDRKPRSFKERWTCTCGSIAIYASQGKFVGLACPKCDSPTPSSRDTEEMTGTPNELLATPKLVVGDTPIAELLGTVREFGRTSASVMDSDLLYRTAAAIESAFSKLREECRGWKDIANSNREAYESVLPQNRVDVLAAARLEGVSEVGAGFETCPMPTLEEQVAALSLENQRLREQFSISDLAQLCTATGRGSIGQRVISEDLRAKLVQMWNEANRRSLSNSTITRGTD